MIKTIIFDIGQVLLQYHPKSFLLEHYKEEDALFLLDTLFLSPLWLDLDRGTKAYAEVQTLLENSYPAYQSEYKFLLANWPSMLQPIASTTHMLPTLKKLGFQLLYLSNFHESAFQNVLEQHQFFKLFDGGVVSFQQHLMKPEPEIYQSLLHAYDLLPNECLFIDDSLANVLAAKQLGFHTIHLTQDLDLQAVLQDYIPLLTQ